MNLVVKYTITGAANVAQLPNDATALGITGVNFVGCATNVAMALGNAVAVNNSDKATILPAVSSTTSGTYVDKIVAIAIPATFNGTTVNYMSVLLSNIGINSDICGVEFIGLNRTETDLVAAFANHLTVRSNISFSSSKSRLIISVLTAANNIAGSIMNIRVTYKN